MVETSIWPVAAGLCGTDRGSDMFTELAGLAGRLGHIVRDGEPPPRVPHRMS